MILCGEGSSTRTKRAKPYDFFVFITFASIQSPITVSFTNQVNPSVLPIPSPVSLISSILTLNIIFFSNFMRTCFLFFFSPIFVCSIFCLRGDGYGNIYLPEYNTANAPVSCLHYICCFPAYPRPKHLLYQKKFCHFLPKNVRFSSYNFDFFYKTHKL